jgi:sortase A
MPIYRYVKKYPKRKMRVPQIFSFFLIFSGVFTLIWAVWPIASFQVTNAALFSEIISPIQNPDIGRLRMNEMVLAASDVSPLSNGDSYNPNTWYPGRPQKPTKTTVDTYTITIPELNIRDAKVIIAGDSLDQSLIHYGGTALPGEPGATVIFGHSTLPQLYDPKDYKTIFSYLPTLKPVSDNYKGDEIFITYDRTTYRYLIYDMKVTKPTDLSALEQETDGSYVTLVTCVPPGTYWQRLNVKGKLVPF